MVDALALEWETGGRDDDDEALPLSLIQCDSRTRVAMHCSRGGACSIAAKVLSMKHMPCVMHQIRCSAHKTHVQICACAYICKNVYIDT